MNASYKADLTNQIFGKLRILREATKEEKNKRKGKFWVCECSCGHELCEITTLVFDKNLIKGKSTKCKARRSFQDLVGKKFGKLLVIKFYELDHNNTPTWECLCDCGNTKLAKTNLLNRGDATTCGCKNIPEILWLSSRNAIICDYKKNARYKNVPFELTDEQCQELFKGDCHYCGDIPRNNYNVFITKEGEPKNNKKHLFNVNDATYIYNGIDRVDSTKGYLQEKGQCVSCCYMCNRSKTNLTEQDWKDYLKRLRDFQNKVKKEKKKLESFSDNTLSNFKFLLGKYKDGAKKRNFQFSLSEEECLNLFKGHCNYCGVKPSSTINRYLNQQNIKNKSGYKWAKNKTVEELLENSFTYNGIDRVKSEDNYIAENCVSCCRICNWAKSNKTMEEWKDWMTRVCKYNDDFSL